MDRKAALELLEWGNAQNPGPWREHSLGVARAAEYIARECGMDADRAWICGAMHDIGKYEGVTAMRHIVAGYELMTKKGEPDIARICLTHSFPLPRIEAYMGPRNIGPEGERLVMDALSTPMDDYDRLIQLCDGLAWNEGVCLMEKRMINVMRRKGVSPVQLEIINARFELLEYFQQKLGKSIYSLFPEAAENTFK